MQSVLRRLLSAAPLLISAAAGAQLTDIASTPLTYSQASQVKPNVMFILDDSGSMGSRFMPEAVNDVNIDKTRCNNSSCGSTTTNGLEGNPPWYAYQFNTIYYNPQITYFPAVDGLGNQMTSFGSPWTSVKVNAFVGSSTINLVSGYSEVVYCKNSSDSPTDANNCRRNGIDTGNPFVYNSTSTNGYPNGTSNGSFRYPMVRGGSPFYYNLLPLEHCSDVALTTCTFSSTPTGNFVYPAVARFCQNSTDANSNSAVTGSTGGKPRCQESWSTSHKYARYGRFERVNIVSTQATYGGRPNRADCASAPTCTYAEEMTNFANWYAYYSTRMQMMKTAVGYAFLELDGRYRVGFITINPGSPVSSSKYSPIDIFSGSQRTTWYSKLYSVSPSGNTPLREALSRVGRHYAGLKTGINSGMNQDPVQYSCQPNVAILSTDGYWNSNGGDKLDGSAMGNTDNVDSGYSTRASGAYDGGLGASGTLADVAMYYYSSDLRTNGSTGALGTDVSENNVPSTTRDMNSGQHMLTFTLGLGLGGFMRYLPNYEAATFGDFYNIRTGNTGCSWGASNAICNWPVPPNNDNDDPSKLDDLWHAAVNGRGRFVSANDAVTLYDGLVTSLSDLRVLVGSAAASATSSPNITTTDNAIYSSTYRTTRWDGEMVAQRIDPATGNVVSAIEWSARDRLNAQDLGGDRHADDLHRQRRRAGAVRLVIDGRRDARVLQQQVRVAFAMRDADRGRARNRGQRREPRQLPARPAPARVGLPRSRVRARRPRRFAAGVRPRSATQLRRSRRAVVLRLQECPCIAPAGRLHRRQRRHAARVRREHRRRAVGLRAALGAAQDVPAGRDRVCHVARVLRRRFADASAMPTSTACGGPS